MGIISIKSTDNLFWLGRYVERVFTTLKIFTEYYDRMIDKDESAYIDFCDKLGIANAYSDKNEFINKFLFDQKEPYSIISNLLLAYDNAVVMRNEISSETLSYVQMAVDAMIRGEESAAPMLKFQEVFDCIFAFWGSADDYVESEATRNILKFGRSVERIDLYLRFSFSPELIKKEFSILINRLYKVGIDCNIEAINNLMQIIFEKDNFEDDKLVLQNELSRLFITIPEYL
ncbi:MAG: alpha-E domain-containing protein [Oscillospiraceae bacterium]